MDLSNQNQINGRLAIGAIGGKVTLNNIQFQGISITPNGLDARIYFDGDVSDLKFVETLTDQTQAETYQGPIIHQTNTDQKI